MRLIKIEAETSGGHAYQTIDHISQIPKGWAVVPDDMDTPNMPYGDITIEDIDGVMTVTSWVARENPEPTAPEPTAPEPTAPEPTAQDDIDAMLVDHELRLTMLELGV